MYAHQRSWTHRILNLLQGVLLDHGLDTDLGAPLSEAVIACSSTTSDSLNSGILGDEIHSIDLERGSIGRCAYNDQRTIVGQQRNELLGCLSTGCRSNDGLCLTDLLHLFSNLRCNVRQQCWRYTLPDGLPTHIILAGNVVVST